ncbi:MAG: UDP-3-O-(3-hydroxymyristoyl)glucosamine N-acyltransferase [Roseinatronobacter sp.]|jgi:UDP-3-O-[3-hydroxymyristoyl] glucosamine N-acyltransferase
MPHTIAQIAQALGLQAEGALELTITHAAEPAQAGPDALAMAMNPKYAAGLAAGRAQAAMLWAGADWRDMGLKAAIFAPRPRWAMAGISEILDPGYDFGTGIHPQSYIHPSAEIGAGAQIGPFTSIGARTKIGPNARIAANVTVAEDVEIGADVILHAGARIGARCRIGARYIGQPNSVIGGCGFSFVTPEPSGAEDVRASLSGERLVRQQKWHRIQSLGAVQIGDDVELGANSSIDRGTIRDTVIGSGTKIDSVCQIGHNVQMGEDCMMCGMAGVAGSARIGNRVLLAGKVAVNDNIFIGDDVIIGGASRVFTNVPAGRTMLGDPATKLETQLEIRKVLRRLPRLAAQVAGLQAAVFGPEKTDKSGQE